FTWAAEQARGAFRDSTWQAFWQTAVEGKSGPEVARALGMTVAAVYLAKGRGVERLEQIIRGGLGEAGEAAGRGGREGRRPWLASACSFCCPWWESAAWSCSRSCPTGLVA